MGGARRDRRHGDGTRDEGAREEDQARRLASDAHRGVSAGADEPDDSELPERDRRRMGVLIKVYGVLCLFSAVSVVTAFVLIATLLIDFKSVVTLAEGHTVTTLMLYAVSTAMNAALSALYVVLGVRLLRNQRRNAARMSWIMILLSVGVIITDIMLYGMRVSILARQLVTLAILIAIWTFLDPQLRDERRLQRKLRDQELCASAQEGTLGRDASGRGYITLNFFNIFWIFVLCSVIGLVIEDVFHLLTVGGYQDRAGLLYGPFSPIYGFGAVLLTMILNRFYKSNPVVIFVVSAIVGGGFEYLVSFFMQFAFGITAWDYSGQPWWYLSFGGGRTCGLFMIFWGALGLLWIRVLLPRVLALINHIPWNWRYAVTSVAAVLLIADGVLTVISLDCWYERLAGNAPDSPVASFCAEHYDDAFMSNRFQTMTIDPDDAARAR